MKTALVIAFAVIAAAMAYLVLAPSKTMTPPMVVDSEARSQAPATSSDTVSVSKAEVLDSAQATRAMEVKENASAPPKDFTSALAAIRLAISKGDYIYSKAELMDLLQIAPSNRELLLELAKLYHLHLRDSASSLSYYEKALAAQPRDGAVINELTEAYVAAEALTRGQMFFADLLQRDPEVKKVESALVGLYVKTQDYDRAEALLMRAIERMVVKPGDSAKTAAASGLAELITAKKELAEIYLASGRAPMAEALVDELQALAPDHDLLRDWAARKRVEEESE